MCPEQYKCIMWLKKIDKHLVVRTGPKGHLATVVSHYLCPWGVSCIFLPADRDVPLLMDSSGQRTWTHSPSLCIVSLLLSFLSPSSLFKLDWLTVSYTRVTSCIVAEPKLKSRVRWIGAITILQVHWFVITIHLFEDMSL